MIVIYTIANILAAMSIQAVNTYLCLHNVLRSINYPIYLHAFLVPFINQCKFLCQIHKISVQDQTKLLKHAIRDTDIFSSS